MYAGAQESWRSSLRQFLAVADPRCRILANQLLGLEEFLPEAVLGNAGQIRSCLKIKRQEQTTISSIKTPNMPETWQGVTACS